VAVMTFSELASLIVGAFSTIGIGLLTIWSTRQDTARNRLHTRLDENDLATRNQGSRLTTLEEQIKHVPKGENIDRQNERLNEKIDKVGLSIAKVEGQQGVITDLLSKLLTSTGESKGPSRR
jgi:hypothetical protein